MTTPAIVKSADLKRMEDEFALGKSGTIYFVTNPEAETVKIGFSSNFNSRMEVLQTGNHVQLLQYSGFQSVPFVERMLQKLFKKHRILNEWFTHVDEIDEMIECFEEFADDDRVLNPEEVIAVFNDWANSYGRGTSATACGKRGDPS